MTARGSTPWAWLAPSPTLHAQCNPFANNAKAIQAGESEFHVNCSFCHGQGAHGGGRGADLSRTQQKRGSTNADLFRTIYDRVPGTHMAAAMGVEMKDQEILQVIVYLRSFQPELHQPK